MSAVAGRTLLAAPAIVPASGRDSFDAGDLALLDEIGEAILPATPGCGGAKAAKIAAFIDEFARDFYSDGQRAALVAGLGRIQDQSRRQYGGRGFLELSAAERNDFLLGIERSTPQPEAYRTIKELVVWGYFTSEIGATQALANVPIPGRYEGIVVIPPGTKAWSE